MRSSSPDCRPGSCRMQPRPVRRSAARPPDVPSAATGALLSVAGHDHPVAALGVGRSAWTTCSTPAVPPTSWPVQCRRAHECSSVPRSSQPTGRRGTRRAGHRPASRRRQRRAAAAPRAGRARRRRAEARDRLDAASLQITTLPPGLIIVGDGRTHEDVEIRLRDDASPGGDLGRGNALHRRAHPACWPTSNPSSGRIAARSPPVAGPACAAFRLPRRRDRSARVLRDAAARCNRRRIAGRVLAEPRTPIAT